MQSQTHLFIVQTRSNAPYKILQDLQFNLLSIGYHHLYLQYILSSRMLKYWRAEGSEVTT